MIAVVAMAIGAAALYAMSDFLEERAASRAGPISGISGGEMSGPVWRPAARSAERTLRRLVPDRQWAVGWAVGTLARKVWTYASSLTSAYARWRTD